MSSADTVIEVVKLERNLYRIKSPYRGVNAMQFDTLRKATAYAIKLVNRYGGKLLCTKETQA